MALPPSGQISFSDIRTELQVPSKAPFTLDTAENGGYVPINVASPSKPSSVNPAAVSEWYSYDHTYGVGCPAYTTGFPVSPTNPYANMWVVDLGTTSGNVNVTIDISYTPSAALWSSAIGCEYGYPYDSNGNFVGGAGGTLFYTNLINSIYTITASYSYNATYGQKIYFTVDANQNSNEWPRFSIDVGCPYPATTPVYINACGDSYADFFGYAFVTVRAMDSYSFYGNAVAVDTYVDSIYVTGDGSTSGTYGQYFGISSGNNCTTGYIPNFVSDELIDSYNVISISPSSSSTQTYITGTGFRDSCWSC